MNNDRRHDVDDHGFKTVISNADVLAMLLKDFLPEFQGMDYEEVKNYLDVNEDTNTVREGNTEIRIEEGCIIMDSAFEIKVPDGTKRSLKVGIESQSSIGKRTRLLRRMQVYGGGMMFSQLGRDISDNRYEDAKDVYTIWIVLNPTTEFKNHIYHYCLRDDNGTKMGGDTPMSGINIIIVGLGSYDDDDTDERLRFVTTLLSPKMDMTERYDAIRKAYMIELDRYVLRGVDKLMSFTENSIEAERYEGMMIEHQKAHDMQFNSYMILMRKGLLNAEVLQELDMEEELREELSIELSKMKVE